MIFIECILGIAFIGMFVVTGSLNTRMWNSYERSELDKQSISDYSGMAAFDGTTVRGQDIVSLITESKGDPFVMVTSGNRIIACSYDDYTRGIKLTADNTGCLRSALDAQMAGAIANNTIDNLLTTIPTQWYYDSASPASSTISDFFLLGEGSDGANNYSSYRTYLVYQDEGSNEIIGIIAQKE